MGWRFSLEAAGGTPGSAGRLAHLVWRFAEQNRDARCIVGLSALESSRQAAGRVAAPLSSYTPSVPEWRNW